MARCDGARSEAAQARHRSAVALAAPRRHGGIAFAGAFAGAQLAVGEGGVHANPGARSTSYLAVLDERTGAAVLEQVIGDERRGIRLPTRVTAMPSGELAVAGPS